MGAELTVHFEAENIIMICLYIFEENVYFDDEVWRNCDIMIKLD